MLATDTIVTYYYSKEARIIIRYLEKKDGRELATSQIETGFEGQDYNARPLDIEGYTLIETVGNESGKLSKDDTEVIYYYAKKVKITIKFIDINKNNEIREIEVYDVYEGFEYNVNEIKVEGYILDNNDGIGKGIAGDKDIEISLYYAKLISAKVEITDEYSGKVIKELEVSGKEGEVIEITPETIEGYDLDIDKSPKDNKIVLSEDLGDIKYYYLKKARVRAIYEDENGKKLMDDKIIEGHEGDKYIIEATIIEGYNLKERPSNMSGNMKVVDGNIETIVRFTYERVIKDNTKADTKIPQTLDKDIKGYKILATIGLLGIVGAISLGKITLIRRKEKKNNKTNYKF